MPSVAIVILNWNGIRYMEQFLPSVLNTDYPNLQVIVADNGSTDGSVDWLERTYPTVRIIRLEKNYGFAGGYNRALQLVDAEMLVLLNSDVEVGPDWVKRVVDRMLQEPSLGACQPKILSWHHRSAFEYAGAAGGWIDRVGFPFARGRVFEHSETDQGQYDDYAHCFWATGAALFIWNKHFRALGGFDERFFAHQEEIDLCWRLQILGFTVGCEPSAIVYHVGGGTLPKGNSLKTYLNFRNNLLMLLKNLRFSEAWWIIPMRFGLDGIAAWRALFTGDAGFFRAVVKAHFYIVGHLLRISKTPGRKRLHQLQGIYHGSLIWNYFIRKRRFFSQIVGNKSVF